MSASALEVCKEFWRVMQAIKLAISAVAEKHRLTFQQAIVLLTLHDSGIVGMGTIACHMHCDASNITGLIDRLVTQGYVVRRESLEDRRTKLLELTKQGHAFVKEVHTIIPAQAGMTKLSPQQRDEFMALLKQLNV